MSAPNIDSLAGQGEFHSKKAGAEPLTHKGHKPGVKVGNDAAPEFNAEVHDSGTAPSKDAFTPNAESEVPGQAQNDAATARTDALSSLPGATSGSIHNATEFGKPAQGETSAEAHGNQKQSRTGNEGRIQPGQSLETGDGSVEGKARAIGADLDGRAGELKGQKGASGASEGGVNWPGAESAEPVGAEELAAERQ
ncbi:hypothetical protein J7T55_012373 [Diaporthe amygdali]|uniref:uncharacterized protein n=1 Tax=Phomopsis amygdali TaxID=1214568 RepID=UPI0022FDC69E|nr:uncharacterized protein J7T55_012373 [Diaporthe amygdali]KAJ0123901.1 hypothetical protein J7T55_012373 [Diaporthe amygdali]